MGFSAVVLTGYVIIWSFSSIPEAVRCELPKFSIGSTKLREVQNLCDKKDQEIFGLQAELRRIRGSKAGDVLYGIPPSTPVMLVAPQTSNRRSTEPQMGALSLSEEFRWLANELQGVDTTDSPTCALIVVDASIHHPRSASAAVNLGWTRIDASEAESISADDVLGFGCFIDPDDCSKRLVSEEIMAAINLAKSTNIRIELFHPEWFAWAVTSGRRSASWWKLLTNASYLAGCLMQHQPTPSLCRRLGALREHNVRLGPHFEALADQHFASQCSKKIAKDDSPTPAAYDPETAPQSCETLRPIRHG